jgi:hypothetical protein
MQPWTAREAARELQNKMLTPAAAELHIKRCATRTNKIKILL